MNVGAFPCFSLSAIKLYHKLCVEVAGQRSFVFSTPLARTGLIYNTMTWCLPLTRIPIPKKLEHRKMHFFVSFLPCYESQITSHRLITCSSVCLWYFLSSGKREVGRWVSNCAGRTSKWLGICLETSWWSGFMENSFCILLLLLKVLWLYYVLHL